MFREVAFLCRWFPPELGGWGGRGAPSASHGAGVRVRRRAPAERRSKRARRVMLWG